MIDSENFEVYRPRLLSVARRYVPFDDADDVVQEALMRAWKSRQGYRASARVYTWLYRITVNTAIDWARTHYPDRDLQLSECALLLSPNISPCDCVASAAGYETLRRLVSHLSDKMRPVVLLTAEGYTCTEIGNMVGCPERTARTRLFRARQELQRKMKGMGI